MALVISERVLFVRERSAGFYKASSYLFSKIIVDMIPVRIIPLLTLGSIMYFMTGLQQVYFNFCRFLLTLALTQFTATSITLFISASCRDFGQANLIGSVLFIFFIIFGGVLVNGNSDSSVLRYLSFVFYAFEALMANEFKGIPLTLRTSLGEIPITGDVVLGVFALDANNLPRDLLVLTAFGIVALILAYISLKTRKRA
jgi:ABC-type multidrug transport system permease subunit